MKNCTNYKDDIIHKSETVQSNQTDKKTLVEYHKIKNKILLKSLLIVCGKIA